MIVFRILKFVLGTIINNYMNKQNFGYYYNVNKLLLFHVFRVFLNILQRLDNIAILIFRSMDLDEMIRNKKLKKTET